MLWFYFNHVIMLISIHREGREKVKVYQPNDKGSALCHRDGRVTTTFVYRDLPFRDAQGAAKNILVGVCDTCGDAIVIPAQSTPAISDAREEFESVMQMDATQ